MTAWGPPMLRDLFPRRRKHDLHRSAIETGTLLQKATSTEEKYDKVNELLQEYVDLLDTEERQSQRYEAIRRPPSDYTPGDGL